MGGTTPATKGTRMTVHVVLEMTMLGTIKIIGVYADEIDAMRVANETIMRKVQAFEVIKADPS
jgi:hypothetical protein